MTHKLLDVANYCYIGHCLEANKRTNPSLWPCSMLERLKDPKTDGSILLQHFSSQPVSHHCQPY